MQIRNFFSIEQIASFQLLIFGLIKIPLISAFGDDSINFPNR